jgi:hypothetical protein
MSDELALFLLLLMFIALVWGARTLARENLRAHPQYIDIFTVGVLNATIAGIFAVYAAAGPSTYRGIMKAGAFWGVVCSATLGIPSSIILAGLGYWGNNRADRCIDGALLSTFLGGLGGLVGAVGTYYACRTLDSDLPFGFLCISNILLGVALAAAIAIEGLRLFGKKKKKRTT